MKPAKLKPSALHRHAERLRSWMYDPHHSRKLRRQVGRWNQLCSALDTIQQTELAMQAYAASAGLAGTGEHYLALYGLLQAMVLQQDAVCHLDEALGGTGTSIGRDQQLQAIRKIRNVSVGHPTKVDRRDVMSHHRISRPKLGKGFELVSEYDDGRRKFTFVSIADLLRKQKLSVARMMRTIVQSLDRRNMLQPIRLKTKNELIQSAAKRLAKPVPVRVERRRKPRPVTTPHPSRPQHHHRPHDRHQHQRPRGIPVQTIPLHKKGLRQGAA